MKKPIESSETTATGTLEKASWLDLEAHVYIKIALLAVSFCALFYHSLYRLVYNWITDPTWSHGFLIPLFSLYFLHQKKAEVLSVVPRPNYLGLAGLLACLVFYPLNLVQFQIAYFDLLILLPAMACIVLFLGGWKLFYLTCLPIGYIFFSIPLPDRLYKGITIPMRLFAADISTVVLNWIPGISATAKGAVIDVMYRGQPLVPALDVAEACSGMRLLMAFVALGVAMAYLHDRPMWHRLALLVSTIPIAILCNVVRVTVTAMIYILWDPRYAQGFYHDLLGVLMLPLAFLLYGRLAWFMANLFTEDKPETESVIVRSRATEERP
jgi:exosortase